MSDDLLIRIEVHDMKTREAAPAEKSFNRDDFNYLDVAEWASDTAQKLVDEVLDANGEPAGDKNTMDEN